MQELTPMMKHYFSLKENYKDCILLYRLGDFYEMFFEDAETCSRVLGLTLTGRDYGKMGRAPLCGVPVKAVDTYICKLIEAGFKVAVCEQLSAPKKGSKEVVERDVVRVITPGTVIESSILDGGSNNYLAVVFKQKDKLGVSYLDISTGEFNITEFNEDLILNLNDLFATIKPKEVIANNEVKEIEDLIACVKMQVVPTFSYIEDKDFEYNECLNTVLHQLKLEKITESYKNKFMAISCAGVLLRYVAITQKRDLSHINQLNWIDNNKNMQIDANSRRNLELTENSKDRGKKGTLLWVLDKTKTNMGKRTLKKYIDSPLLNVEDINYRLNGVEELVKNIVSREQLKELLYNIYDIERLTARISYNNINPKDCLALNKSLSLIPEIKKVLLKLNSKIVNDIISDLDDYSDVVDLLTAAIREDCSNNFREGNFIKQGFNKELDEIIEIQTNSSNTLSLMEASEKELTGIKNLKIGFNRVFGYYIEVAKSQIEMVPFRYIRKQTLAGGERYITEELKELEEKILHAGDRQIEIELDLFNYIRNFLLTKVKNLQITAKAIGVLDTILSFATVSAEKNYVKPVFSKNNKNIEIIEGRHPVVETILKNDFVPNDTIMNDSDSRTMLITGPNMAGKSTYMRQVALICIMAQIGCFVPAKSAKMTLTDRIFTRIGASDDLLFGQSTFMVEMSEVSNILNNATNSSLVLLDEIGRGTSTFDGLSIAWSIMEYIAKNYRCKTLFSTHFHELTDLEGLLDGVKNYKVMVKEYNNTIIFLRKIVRGSANRSFGIEVASLADLPQEVIDRAKQILHSLEQHDLNKDLINEVESNTNEEKSNYRQNLNEVAGILKELNVNTLTPLNAFDILIQLKGYVEK